MKLFVGFAIVVLAAVQSSVAQDQSIAIVRDNGVCLAAGPGGTTIGPCKLISFQKCKPGYKAYPRYDTYGCIIANDCVPCPIYCCWCLPGQKYTTTYTADGCPCCGCVGNPYVYPYTECACDAKYARANITLSPTIDRDGEVTWSTTCQCSATLKQLPSGVSWN